MVESIEDFGEEPEGKRQLGRPSCGEDDNIEMNFRE
jgi:hypothetical protein